MGAATRYEIIGTLATGDFATVYRGRDRELGRDVAIKEIHPHFRRDPKQLERYWREAQLLASLQHPNIITIYDVVRSRGWLILELMRDNLQKGIEKGPVDLDFLREILCDSLQALEFLHKNGIVHGDIKPSNLLLDKEGRVKLGDFGLARRATDEHGSLLKGTTKYMAPELISAQFGAVGPASDLYSLGFTAYELMCGPDFELLFPTLSTFGRDRQIAWMMWHASADQKLPPIHRVLEGVPEDMAEVVDRLVQKNQQERIRSASEALQRLKRPVGVVTPPPVPEEIAEGESGEQIKKRRTRLVAIAAVICSLVLSVLMLLPREKETQPPVSVEPVSGRVEQVLLDARLLIVDRGPLGKEELEVRSWDEVFVNDKKSLLRDLQPGDQITITIFRDDQGRRIQRIEAVRPERLVGQIEAISPETGSLNVAGMTGEPRLTVRVPQGTTITLNESDTVDGRSLELTDLAAGDRVELEYQRADKDLMALKVAAYRVVRSKGVLKAVDTQNQQLRVELVNSGKTVTLPWSTDCVVTVNGQTVIAGQPQRPTDLLPNDEVDIEHDVVIRRIEAYRILGVAGIIQQVHFDANAIDVQLKSDGKTIQFTVPATCEITLGGAPATITDLRNGDQVDIQHDTLGATVGRALKIAAIRPANPARFALLVAVEDFDDQSIPKATGVVEGVKRLADILIQRGAFPRNQTLILANPSRVRFEQGLSAFFKSTTADAEVLVYYVGHAAKDANGQIFLLCKESQLNQPPTTGISLQHLADALERAEAKGKVLLIDVPSGQHGPPQPPLVSAEEALKGVKGPPGMAPFRTVTAIAASAEGQGSLPAKEGTVFTDILSQAYQGKADDNRDGRVEVGELYAYLSRQVPALTQNQQTPRIFLPDNRPPRLSDEAKTAIRQLAAMVLQENLDSRVVGDTYRTALKLSGKEPEPTILYALVQIKMGQTADAQRVLETLKLERPRELITYLGLAWVKLLRRDYAGAVQELNAFVQNWQASQLKTDPGQVVTQLDANGMFTMIGQLREFAERVADDSERPNRAAFETLDDGVKQLGDAAAQAYAQGRGQIKELIDRFDEELSRAPDQATAVRLRYERRQLGRYTRFPFAELSRQVIEGLDR
ncbi:MAG: protein kinase domain-containing protein [Thermogutta sp.]